MAEYQINVKADASAAQNELRKLREAVDRTTGTHQLNIKFPSIEQISQGFKNLGVEVTNARTGVSELYKVSKQIPGLGKNVRSVEYVASSLVNVAKAAPGAAKGIAENGLAGDILANAFNAAARSTQSLTGRLAKMGFALFAVKEATSLLQAAFGGFFQATIGRQLQLEDTILRTQTSLASTSKVFADGVEITDPYKKIVALTEAVEKHVDNIRKRSIELAGVTSGEVIEVFGMVAQQISQIGGGLQDAEDLAINFAAALGTFGLPLYQARQEIGSIIRADITHDSYLAKALGITNSDIQKAKTETNGVVGYLQERLSAAVAGQKIAAEGFAGVVSNIREIGEEVQRNFGMGLLAPLLAGLKKVFSALYSISTELWNSAKAFGEGLGKLIGSSVGNIASGNSFMASLGSEIQELANGAQKSIESAFTEIRSRARDFVQPVRDLLNEVVKILLLVGSGLKDLAIGFADISTETLEAIVSTLASIAGGFTAVAVVVKELLSIYGELLRLPLVQYFAQLGATLKVLDALGLSTMVRLGMIAKLILTRWKIAITFIGGIASQIGSILSIVVNAVGVAFTRIAALIKVFALSLIQLNPHLEATSQELLKLATSLTHAGNSAKSASIGLQGFGGAIVNGIKAMWGAIWGFLKFNLAIIAITVAIGVLIDVWNRWKKEAEDKRALDEINKKLERRAELIKINKDELTEAQKRELDAANSALWEKYDRQQKAVQELTKELKRLDDWEKRATRGASRTGGVDNIRGRIRLTRKEREEALLELQKLEKQLDEDRIKSNITLEQNKRIDLAKEIRGIEIQYANDVFNARMQLERTKLQLIEVENELLLAGVDKANAERLRGERGVSRETISALNAYFRSKQEKELNAQQQERRFQLQIQDIEKKIADYRLKTQEKIDELRKKAGLRDLEFAQKKAQLEARIITQDDFDKFVLERKLEAERSIEGVGLNPEYASLIQAGLAVESQILGIQGRIRDIQDQTAVENLIESLFPLEDIETVKRSIVELTRTLKERIKTGNSFFDPEKVKMQVELERKLRDYSVKRGTAINRASKEWEAGLLNTEEMLYMINAINAAYERQVQELSQINKKQKQLNDLKNFEQGLSMAQDVKTNIKEQLQDMRTRHRLEMEGVRAELIDAQIEKDRLQRELSKRTKDIQLPGARELIAQEANNAMAAIDARAQQGVAGNDPVLQLFKQYRKEITDTRAIITSLASTITSELGSAMSQSIEALIEGTQSVQEVFANMFKNIGKAFIDMATQMIAKWMIMQVLGMFTSGAGAAPGLPVPKIAPGEKYGPGYSTGGIASGPETGYSATLHGTEAVVPLPDGKRIPVEISGGAGGSVNSVVNVTISDSGTTVSRDRASNLGRMIETSVMNIITRERRPGGMLRN